MKFISWNIDSLNAALTGTSPRSELTRNVLGTIRDEDADVIAIQETKLPEAGMSKKQAEALERFFRIMRMSGSVPGDLPGRGMPAPWLCTEGDCR
jgi:exonuclease III